MISIVSTMLILLNHLTIVIIIVFLLIFCIMLTALQLHRPVIAAPISTKLTEMECDLTFQKSILIDYFLRIKMLNLCLIIFTRFFTLLLIFLFLINVPPRIPNVIAWDTQLVSESYSAKSLLRGASTAPRKRLNLVFIITL